MHALQIDTCMIRLAYQLYLPTTSRRVQRQSPTKQPNHATAPSLSNPTTPAVPTRWICALPIELVAAEAMLDERYKDDSSGQYTLGRIGHHKVVMACLPAGLIGTNAAATVATKMVFNFPSIRFGLMVGIGGGVPSEASDIRLGDVVVSQPQNGNGGVVQYDFGKARPGEFETTGFLNAPPIALLDALSVLKTRHLLGKSRLGEYIGAATHRLQFALETTRTDMLFESNYEHNGGSTSSGNQVIRDGRIRDSLSSKLGGVLCFEMEAAGLMNNFPSLVIRGICDYADSHKNKAWQPYAAITAAAYAKEVLTVIHGNQIATTEVADDAIKADMIRIDIESNIDAVNLDWFLSVLPAVNQPEFKPKTPLLDREDHEYHWVFKNLDFINWDRGNSGVLWLSAPPDCDLQKVASSILQRELDKSPQTHKRTLYYYCGTNATDLPTIKTFIRELALQVISSAAEAKQASIVRTFLRTILHHMFKRAASATLLQWLSGYIEDHLCDLLDAPEDSLWAALWAILPTEQDRSLSVFITGIEYVCREHEFIRAIRDFIKALQSTGRAKVLLTSGIDFETREILRGLPYIDYDEERKACEGTFMWLWEHPQYKAWTTPQTSSILLIEGKPGSGKSTLTKYFNDYMLQEQPSANSAIVAKFFYSYRDGSLQRSHYSMLRSLLHDIMSQDPAFFYQVQAEYRRQKHCNSSSGIVDWDYDSLKRMLRSLLDYPLPRSLYLIIDAVDESDEEDRRSIIKLLFEIAGKTTLGVVKIFVASRPVEQLDVRRQNINSIIKLQAETLHDISRFARSILDGLNVSLLLDKATEYIINNANGVFLWVRLVGCELEASLEDCESEDVIFQRLKQLPTELDDFYQLMLARLDNKPYTADSITMFQSILWAARPVTPDELLQAVAISNIPPMEPLTDESLETRIPLKGRITRCGGNFLEFKQSNGFETVQIMHQTVRDFFLRPHGYAAQTRFLMREKDAIEYVAKMCVRYLILCSRCTILAKRLPATSLWNWQHFDAYVRYLNRRPLVSYALSFFEQYGDRGNGEFGMSDLVAELNQERQAGAPFVYLLEKWASSTLKIGLIAQESGAPAEKPADAAMNFRIDLSYVAVTGGYHVAVEILLTAGTDINYEWKGGRTALSLAAEKGHAAVVNVLLANEDVLVNRRDEKGKTPMCWAAEKGHEDVVVGLLGHKDIEAFLQDGQARTPLSLAAENGHEAVVNILVKRNVVVVNHQDNEGKTALLWAVEEGHLGVVTGLLSHYYIDPNVEDQLGRTPLSLATEQEDDAMVRLLLSHPLVKADSPQDKGKSR
ncbi:ankyrin [Trichoderma reesei RUT C-30]|uniref:Ankyrin n=1 Tax=Hypocrea jecorina (strain ATCC 56765 / BCRC 32924 / NRRL 11460 / Rut C-30) TaxID=1344414 RepID=A0A024S2P1_HYPJR|nr:ankyrin [Trichoderma reesei RUT C-30]